MKPARLLVLAIAVSAAGAAALLMTNTSPPATVVVEKAAPVRTTEVLVAGADLGVGQVLRAGDMRWQPWPQDYVPSGAITRAQSPSALDELAGAIIRQSFLAGEPVRREKVIKADGSGFMSAILPSGMRAVAISIDTRGATSAGGFVLPNDRVDVLRVYRDDEASKAGGVDVQMSETILRNIRVLAIGQNVQERNGEKVVTGETATLEVTPGQAETLALAQRVGQLSLALRSLADAKTVDAPIEERDSGLVVVRAGVARQAARR
ncbi:MAG: Flp pilus assembly protein CpaB [Methylobacteriaceae bacterium]|nr:Flp pilus assembly protein CpaB [Methylobacteriaceae bacterium]